MRIIIRNCAETPDGVIVTKGKAYKIEKKKSEGRATWESGVYTAVAVYGTVLVVQDGDKLMRLNWRDMETIEEYNEDGGN